jgi:hypothetical protein
VISQRGRRMVSLYDHVGVQLADLVSRFDLCEKNVEIRRAYEMLCRESLNLPMGQRPPTFSRINDDGTPFQYALTLAPGRLSPLQFLSEAGIPGSSVIDRAALSRERIDSLCKHLAEEEQGQQLRGLLERIAPFTAFELETDHAGTFWIGIRFSSDSQAHLIVYINGKTGNGAVPWTRANEFAECLGAEDVWQGIEPILTNGTELLGFAFTVSRGRPITGRIYARSNGKPIKFFHQIVQALNQPGAEEVLRQFVEIMMGEEMQYPFGSAVCSVGLSEQSKPDFKLEFCAHCMFADDRDAVTHCSRWLDVTRADQSRYHQLLQVIAPQGLSSTRSQLHSFVGFGWKDQELYTSMYLKPQIISSSG